LLASFLDEHNEKNHLIALTSRRKSLVAWSKSYSLAWINNEGKVGDMALYISWFHSQRSFLASTRDGRVKIPAFSQTHIAPDRRVFTAHLSAGSSDNEDSDNDDEFDQTANGNRSLAWTNKYRKLLPYEYARAEAMNLGLRCREEWDEYLADGEFCHGPYLPSRPDEMYKEDWVSWEDFLGIARLR
jgi:hypothetical protein